PRALGKTAPGLHESAGISLDAPQSGNPRRVLAIPAASWQNRRGFAHDAPAFASRRRGCDRTRRVSATRQRFLLTPPSHDQVAAGPAWLPRAFVQSAAVWSTSAGVGTTRGHTGQRPPLLANAAGIGQTPAVLSLFAPKLASPRRLLCKIRGRLPKP